MDIKETIVHEKRIKKKKENNEDALDICITVDWFKFEEDNKE